MKAKAKIETRSNTFAILSTIQNVNIQTSLLSNLRGADQSNNVHDFRASKHNITR